MAFIKKYLDGIEEAIQRAMLPSGAIVYFGNRTTAPSGWAICNGQTVTMRDGTSFITPNLIDRYPLGATSGIKGNVEPSLPKITGYVSFGSCYIDGGSGAFRYTSTTHGVQNTAGRTGFHDDFDFDASRCSSVYNRTDDKVYPASVKLLPCMKL